MTNKSRFLKSVIVLSLITFHVVFAVPISYDDFLECMEEAVRSVAVNDSNLKWPEEFVHFMKEELYEKKDFGTTSKNELTKIIARDLKSREIYFEGNKRFFQTFINKVLVKDMDNYPAEGSSEDPTKIMFLSKIKMEEVDKFIEKTIAEKKVTLTDDWKVLTLKDAFRTVFFYSKYPKELATILSEDMRVEVKDWLDSMPTWGNRGFDEDAHEEPIQLDKIQKFEL